MDTTLPPPPDRVPGLDLGEPGDPTSTDTAAPVPDVPSADERPYVGQPRPILPPQDIPSKS